MMPVYAKGQANSANYNYLLSFQEYFVVGLLIVFFGFRGYVLIDWINYSKWYADSPTLFDGFSQIKLFFELGKEKGFLFYMVLCKTISSNYLFFQFISSVTDVIILNYFFKRVVHENIIMCFVFFILFSGLSMEMHLLRNVKSILIFMLSIKYIEERKIIKYSILNCIGALFHISSLLYIPLYFILDKKIPRLIVLFIFILGNFIFFLRIEWVKLFLSNVSVPGRLGLLSNHYLASSVRYSQAVGFTIGYFERCFSFFLVYYFSNKLIKIDKANIVYINVLYIYSFMYLYFSEMYIIIERLVKLFIFSYWVIYPKMYLLFSRKSKYIFISVLLLYGTLKLGMSYNKYFNYYDNVLLSYKSFEEREMMYNKYQVTIEQYIINKEAPGILIK
ncbi:MAG: EpsG family protein [Treponema sp.]|jgi:hypothetical protein|nr:EpsG family protein [Treponema sp.]